MKILPKTKPGKYSLWLSICGLAAIIILNIINESLLCPNGLCSLNNSWRIFQIILSLISIASILLSGVLSFVSIIKYKERAILVFIPALLGILALIFLLGELFIEH